MDGAPALPVENSPSFIARQNRQLVRRGRSAHTGGLNTATISILPMSAAPSSRENPNRVSCFLNRTNELILKPMWKKKGSWVGRSDLKIETWGLAPSPDRDFSRSRGQQRCGPGVRAARRAAPHASRRSGCPQLTPPCRKGEMEWVSHLYLPHALAILDGFKFHMKEEHHNFQKKM